jgi:hypothetical protein
MSCPIYASFVCFQCGFNSLLDLVQPWDVFGDLEEQIVSIVQLKIENLYCKIRHFDTILYDGHQQWEPKIS